MGTGMTTQAMQTFSTFLPAGWDFINTWRLPAGDYPRLRWESELPVSYGSLQVTLLPAEAVGAGAQWRRVGTSDWLDNGEIESSVLAGNWYVEFKVLPEWVYPKQLTIQILPNMPVSIDVSYRDNPFSFGNGTADDPFQIRTVDDWLALIRDPKDWNKCLVLNQDLDFEGQELTPVAPDTDSAGGFQGTPFTGRLDGQGHVLRNFSINLPGSVHVGLFGCLGSGGTIRNLGVEDVQISATSRVGGLVGWNNGGSLHYCHGIGRIIGGDSLIAIGGLCGKNDGTIINCYASMAITTGAKSRSSVV